MSTFSDFQADDMALDAWFDSCDQDFDDRERDGWSEREDFAVESWVVADAHAAAAWDDVSDDWRYRDACDYPPF